MSWRSRLAVSVLLLALATCKKDGEQLPSGLGGPPQRPAVDVDKLETPPLFAHIPADTPYIMAAFEAAPLEYMQKVKRSLGPALARTVDRLRSLARDTDVSRWIDAVTDELDGKWNVKGLESLGLSAKPRFALYGHGIAPVVFRIEVKDTKAVLATVERIAARAGAQLPALENRHGREFWRIELPGDFGAIIALADRQLVAAFGPRHAIAAVMPQIVGSEKPTRSMADGKQLKDLIAKHRLGPQLIGYVDTKRTANDMFKLMEHTPSQDCTSEIDRIASQVPRLVFSYTEISDKRHSGGVILELAPGIVERLKELRVAVPGLAAALADNPAFAIGGGLDLERGKAAGKAAANVLRDLGEACEAQPLTRAARDMREVMTEPLPGPLAKIVGGAIAIDSIEFGKSGKRLGPSMPRDVDGFAMLATKDAKAVFEAMSDDLGPVRALDLKANGKLQPIELTQLGLPFDGYAGIGEQVIAGAVGKRGKRRAEKALAATGGSKSPFLASSLDMGKLYEMQAELGAADDITRDLNESMSEIFGRTTFSLDVTDTGLAMWYATELK
jgi:hypothetical protein